MKQSEAAMNMNNVVVRHKGHKIVIKQLKNSDEMNIMQEIMVWGPNVAGVTINFHANGPWLVEALQEAIAAIDNASKES